MTVIRIVPMPGVPGPQGPQGPQGVPGTSANLVVPVTIDDSNGNDFITFTRTGTGTARIESPQDDLSLRSARDITLFPGTDGPGEVYIGWGDAEYTPTASNRVATFGDVDETVSNAINGIGLDNIKTRIWEYPSDNAVAIMPEIDNESIALKSSDAAAIRWHIRNNGVSGGTISPISATVTPGDGNYQVVFIIPEQDSVPPTGSYYYQINCPENSAFNAALFAQAATATSLTFYYETDPGVFNASGAEIYPPSVYSQFEVDSNGAHVKIADWSSGPGSYSHTWDFTNEGAIHFPYGPSNSRTGSGDVLKFATSFDQSIITGVAPTVANPTANRLVISGQDGVAGTSFDGEGGDLYLWAGRGGGEVGGGGDVKIDAGNGSIGGAGGYVKIRGGYSQNSSGGFVNIDAGDSNTSYGGTINIRGGSVYNGDNIPGGNVNINAGYSNSSSQGGDIVLTAQTGGQVILNADGGEFLNDASIPNNQIATLGDFAYTRVNVPTTSLGQAGDIAHYVADDTSHHYFCTGTYDGTTNIWKRMAWSNDTWGA